MSLKNKILFLVFPLMLVQNSYADGACPWLTRNEFDAIDAALPCVNFTGLPPEDQMSEYALMASMRQGVYNELIRQNSAESICRSQLYHEKIADTAQMGQIYDAIQARFVHYRSALRNLRLEDAQDEEATRVTLQGLGPEGHAAGAGTMMLSDMRAQERNQKRDRLIARIPYGFEPQVAEAIRKLDAELPENFPEGATPAQMQQFRNAIREGFVKTELAYSDSYTHFQSLFRTTDCLQRLPNGNIQSISTPVEMAGVSCPAGQEPTGGSYVQEDGTWRAFSQSGAISNLAEEIQASGRVGVDIRETLTCRADPYRARREALTSFAIASAPLALIPGAGLLVVAGISAVVYTNEVINSCFGGQATGFRVVQGTACRDGLGLDGAIHAADTTDCGEDALALVGAVAFSGVGAELRAVTAGEAALSDAARVAGAADNFAASGERAVVESAVTETGTAGRVTGEARAGAGARGAANDARVTGRVAEDAVATGERASARGARGAGGAADNVAAEAADVGGDAARTSRGAETATTSPGRVPASTEASRLVDQNFDNVAVRLSEDQERLIQAETFERKTRIDTILRNGGARDIHAEHDALNAALDAGDLEGFIRAREMTVANAQELRESVEIMQRERAVLTRSRVNQDLAAAEREGAQVREVSCDTVNQLNSTPAFHTRARCSVITFTRAVENYCACGGRGGLGAWAGPCANAVEDYLTGGQLADRDALPPGSARNLRECKRIRIPAGTTVVHGGLRPTFAGHGGAAQIYLPSRGLNPRVPRPVGDQPFLPLDLPDSLNGTRAARSELGIPDSAITAAPEIEVVAVAPLSTSREITEIYNAGRVCRQNPGGCTPSDIERMERQFTNYSSSSAGRGRISSDERQEFQEWFEWVRGCRPINISRGSSFGAFDPTRPGCRNRRTF